MYRSKKGEADMGNIIAICNQKGGVAKTTTAFNLGAALALNKGKKVLLIDADPQANLSEYLRFEEDPLPTLSYLIADVAQNTLISAETVGRCIRHHKMTGLYYIPAAIDLANAETIMATALSRETILKRILMPEITKDFDYILIDCLPSLGSLLINALTAADNMIIPVQTQKFSIDGLNALYSLYLQIRSTINPALHLTGILATMADHTVVTRTALQTLSADYGEVLFRTVIHKSVDAAKSSESGIALCTYRNRLGEEYIALADELDALLVQQQELKLSPVGTN